MASVKCYVCSDALAHDHGGVRCTSDQPHHLCGDCSILFCSFKLNELSADAFPPACSMCSEPVTLASFDAHLNAEQRTRFLEVSLTHALAESESTETIVRCPHCSYFETRSNAEHMNFVFCRRDGCEKVSCAVCFEACALPTEGSVPSLVREPYLDQAHLLGMERHFGCKALDSEFGESCSAFAEALSMGQTMACPTCMQNGVSSRAIKDDACTHMECDTCQTVWCYLCGLDTASEECSKAPLEEHPQMSAHYRHNRAWFSDERQCPMHLYQIHELDPSWPADDQSALELFHRKRTLRLLKAVYDRIGQEAYRRMIAAVPRFGAACGFSEEEIRAAVTGKGYYARSDEFVPQAYGEEDDEDEGLTELMAAADDGNIEVVTGLLAVPGLNVNAADGGGWTALMLAVAGGHTSTVTALLAAPGINVNAAAINGDRALLWVARRGRTEMATVLLAAPGLELNAADAAGWTALMHAASEGHTETATALLAAPGLDVLNAVNRRGDTALKLAAFGGHTSTVTLLLAAPGLNVNAADRADEQTALMLAAAEGHTEMVTALLAAPDIDVNAADGAGQTALMLPAIRGHIETITALLAAPGLDVNAAAGDGYTALIRAVRGGHTEMVTALLAAPGLDVNAAAVMMAPRRSCWQRVEATPRRSRRCWVCLAST